MDPHPHLLFAAITISTRVFAGSLALSVLLSLYVRQTQRSGKQLPTALFTGFWMLAAALLLLGGYALFFEPFG